MRRAPIWIIPLGQWSMTEQWQSRRAVVHLGSQICFRGSFCAAISTEEEERGGTKAIPFPGKLSVDWTLQEVRAKRKEASKLWPPVTTLPAVPQSLFLCLLLPLHSFFFFLFLLERFSFYD